MNASFFFSCSLTIISASELATARVSFKKIAVMIRMTPNTTIMM